MYLVQLLRWPTFRTASSVTNVPTLADSINSGWSVVGESEADKSNAKFVEDNNKARRRELELISNETGKKRGSANFKAVFEEYISLLNESDRYLLAQKIDSPEAYSIMKKIVRDNSAKLLQVICTWYRRRPLIPSDSWDSLVNDWHEQQFSKGVEGRLRDTALIRYGNNITPQTLANVLHSLSSTIQGILREYLHVDDLTIEEIEELETILESAVLYIIALHVQVARNVSTSKANEGNLPKLWAEEAINAPKKVPDAKFVKLERTTVGETERKSKEEMNKVRFRLSKLFVPRV